MKKTIKSLVKDKFDYDILALAPYIDEQSENLDVELINQSLFMSKLNIMSGVKGSEKIKMLADDLVLQDAESCGWAASGGMVFTDKTISNMRIKFQEEYCNENLNGAWTQMKNKIGANVQDLENPFGDVIMGFKAMQIKKAMQDLLVNGDTTSGTPNLAFFDGLSKKLTADALVLSANSVQTSITDLNAFGIFKEVSAKIPTVLRSTGTEVEIVCGEESAQSVINNIWNDKDYNAVLEFQTNDAGELWFPLPTTTYTVRVLPQLNGTEKVFAIPYSYVSVAVDGESDESNIEVKYNETDELLRISNKFRLGVEYIRPEYFVKLVLA
jgi:hypothetical protein